jgi:hypothetical protein
MHERESCCLFQLIAHCCAVYLPDWVGANKGPSEWVKITGSQWQKLNRARSDFARHPPHLTQSEIFLISKHVSSASSCSLACMPVCRVVKCYLSQYWGGGGENPQQPRYQSTKQAGLIALEVSKYELNQIKECVRTVCRIWQGTYERRIAVLRTGNLSTKRFVCLRLLHSGEI